MLHHDFAINIGLKISAYFTYHRDISKKKKSHLSANIKMTTNVLGIYADYARKKIPDYIKLHSATQINVLLYTDAPLISSQSVSIVESRSSLPSRERHC